MKSKMKKLLILSTGLFCVSSLFAQENAKLDTLYYTADWKVVESPTFAAYKRIAEVNDNPHTRKHFRDYYITGELQSEGNYLTLDENDDQLSVFDGSFTNYYKNGKVKEKGNRIKGVFYGESTVYYENGLVKTHCFFKNGKVDGILTQFSEDGSLCSQVEYKDGEPLYDYYTLSNAQGYVSKLRLSDNTPIHESPDENEIKKEYKNGITWQYYIKNGLMVAATNTEVKDYGKYYQISIVIANNSVAPIQLYPSRISSSGRDKKGNFVSMHTLSVDEYMKKVGRRQNWMSALNGLAEGLAASNAVYSSSTTNSSTYSSGSASVYGDAMAVGSGGWAAGSYSGTGYYSGSSYTSSTTTSYDGAAAYQAQVIASNRIASYDNSLLQERAIKQAGYLKNTTIYPGETISGYVNVQRKKGKEMTVSIKIEGADYKFSWNIAK